MNPLLCILVEIICCFCEPWRSFWCWGTALSGLLWQHVLTGGVSSSCIQYSAFFQKPSGGSDENDDEGDYGDDDDNDEDDDGDEWKEDGVEYDAVYCILFFYTYIQTYT